MALTSDIIECLESKAPNVWATIQEAKEMNYEFVANDTSPTVMLGGMHLTSSYDRSFEAFHQAERIPLESAKATVYGFGLGDIVRELLARPGTEALDLVVMNPQIARLSLTLFDHSDWILDERVAIHLGEAHASPTEPYALSPVCVKLASDDNRELANLLLNTQQEELPAPEELLDALELSALAFIHGVDKQASDYLVQFIDMLTEVLSTGQPEETIQGFMEIIAVTVKAQERKDFLLVADFLLYEFRSAIADD
jgi:hypothetical protein